MRFAKLAAVAAAALVGAATAHAAEVKQEIEVKAAPAAVWKKIGAFCSIKAWHPAVANCEQSKVGGDTFRLLTLKDGAKIKEKFVSDGRNSYTYSIVESPLPVSNYTATLSVKADGDGDKNESDVIWTAKFDPKDKPEAEAKGVIEGIFKGGLENIKALIKADNEAADKAKAERKAKIDAAKVAALAKLHDAKVAAAEKLHKAKLVIAEKAKQVSDAAKAAYEKAKAEVAAAQTPEAKAERKSKIEAAKVTAAEKLAQAKQVIAEKAQQAADAAKVAYEKTKTEAAAAVEAAKQKAAAPAAEAKK